MGSHKDPSAWDYCWQLVKERAKLKQPGDLGRLICLISSRHLLSPGYQAWFRAYLIATAGSVALSTAPPCLPPLVIDLNYVAPPTEILVRMLKAAVRLVFVAAEAKELAAALNLLFNRLERHMGAAAAQAAWERGVTWYEGVADEARSLILRWAVDDRFAIAGSGIDLVFLRLEGNASNARPGLMEWAGAEPLPDVARAVVALVADGVVRAEKPRAVPLSVQVRSYFFDEMLSVSRFTDGDLGLVTEGLKAGGWRFAGDDEAWDRFLRTRHDAYPFSAVASAGIQGLASGRDGSGASSGLPPTPLERAHWELGSWKHAKALAKRLGGKGGAATAGGTVRRWSAPAVSQHLALFLGLLTERLAAVEGGGSGAGAETARAATDFLCGAALGLPAPLGTPLTFLAGRGRRRRERYAMTHWPRLNTIGSASLDHL
jgi:hypothetical protein